MAVLSLLPANNNGEEEILFSTLILNQNDFESNHVDKEPDICEICVTVSFSLVLFGFGPEACKRYCLINWAPGTGRFLLQMLG